MKPNADGTYTLTMLLGTVDLPRPTGRFETDAEGWTREIYTDWIDRDRDGNEIGRRPNQYMVRWKWN